MYRTQWFQDASPKHIAVPAHGQSVVTCLLISEGRVITAADDGKINIYSLQTGELTRSLDGHDGGVWALAVFGNTIASGSTDRTVRVWDMEWGRCTHTFCGHTATVRCITIVHPEANRPAWMDGDVETFPTYPLIVSGSRDHTLVVWALPKPGDAEYHSAVVDDAVVEDRVRDMHIGTNRPDLSGATK